MVTSVPPEVGPKSGRTAVMARPVYAKVGVASVCFDSWPPTRTETRSCWPWPAGVVQAREESEVHSLRPHASPPILPVGCESDTPKPYPVMVTRMPPPTAPEEAESAVTTGGSYSKETEPNVDATGKSLEERVTGRPAPTPAGATHFTLDWETQVVCGQGFCPPPYLATAADTSRSSNLEPKRVRVKPPSVGARDHASAVITGAFPSPNWNTPPGVASEVWPSTRTVTGATTGPRDQAGVMHVSAASSVHTVAVHRVGPT
mmetsp:Transcript_43880/g.103803  ORF Transcript_43880/g.103803 Transcript_43880/m.103803 type:complete len:260 (+) Transcript_43880:785-1564(+)